MGHRNGFFITFEGIEGSGKTTQARLLAERLGRGGREAMLTFEPGDTAIGQQIRSILLHPGHTAMSEIAELLLYNADRIQHLDEKVRPALGKGRIVISDRFTDSTVAYQGFGRGISISLVNSLDNLITGGLLPDLTFLLDLDATAGLDRNRCVNKRDRLELEELAFHERVRRGFLSIAAQEPQRVMVIDASQSMEVVQQKVWEALSVRIATSMRAES